MPVIVTAYCQNTTGASPRPLYPPVACLARAEVPLAQSLLRRVIGFPEEPTALKFGNEQLAQVRGAASRRTRHEVESVDAGAFQPFLHPVGHLPGLSEKHEPGIRMGSLGYRDEIAQAAYGKFAARRGLLDESQHRVQILGAQVRHGGVLRVSREVHP